MIDTDFYLSAACDMGEQHALRTRTSSARSEVPVLVERVEEHHPWNVVGLPEGWRSARKLRRRGDSQLAAAVRPKKSRPAWQGNGRHVSEGSVSHEESDHARPRGAGLRDGRRD